MTTGRCDPARLTLGTILVLTLMDLVCGIGRAALGLPHPYTALLIAPHDLFGDFFKVVRSFGDGAGAAGLGLPLYPEPADGGYDPKTALGAIGAHPHITHYHLTPLSALLAILTLWVGKAISLAMLFAAATAGLMIGLWRIVRSTGAATPLWLAAALVSYPLLYLVTRGNLYAGLTDLIVLQALLLVTRGRSGIAAALCLAAAISIRPNAVIFALPLLAFCMGHRRRVAATLLLGTAATTLGSLVLVHAAYPAYDLPTFLAGLARYRLLYVVGDDGLPGNSSLFGALKLVFGYRPWQETAATVVALGCAGAGCIAWLHGRVSRPACLFLTCAAYCLGSAVFGDYHLLVFLAPGLVASIEGRQIDLTAADDPLAPALLGAAAMLAPKTFLFVDDLSAQLVLNPLLLLATSVTILRYAAAHEKGRPVTGPPFLLTDPGPRRGGPPVRLT